MADARDALQEESMLESPHNANLWLTDFLAHPRGDHGKLLSNSRVLSMTIGTGFDILSAACDFILKHIKHELIFVTCFWAKSDSLFDMSDLLLALSEKALASHRKIRVRICVSSLSITQKLFHTWSPQGKIYSSSDWKSTFQIPSEHNLTGLDLEIKSVFIPPFSVMHSKFIVMDREVCLLPSCNVSWENWFEGCLDLRGPIVAMFLEYWESFWGRDDPKFSIAQIRLPHTGQHMHTDGVSPEGHERSTPRHNLGEEIEPFATRSTPLSPTADSVLPLSSSLASEDIRTIFLPSPYHQNPHFRPLPCQRAPEVPQTPLNTFTLQALEGSMTRIYLQTPNVTSPPVLDALLRALKRGVSIRIVSNERLMTLEQLATAGTTTPRCIRKLIQSYETLRQEFECRRYVDGGEDTMRVGKLLVDFYAPRDMRSGNSWPVSSHIKLTIVDGEVVVLGSGNMDRASWYTSQELGVALISREAAKRIADQVTAALKDRLQRIYTSS